MIQASLPPFWNEPTGDNFALLINDNITWYYQDQVERHVAKDVWGELFKGKLDRLENAECVQEYAASLLDHRRHLILVVPAVPADNGTSNNRGLGLMSLSAEFRNDDSSGCSQAGYEWICFVAFEEYGNGCQDGQACSKQAQRIDPHSWKTMEGLVPEYCLSEPVTQTCALRFSSSLAWVVITFNILKLVILLACCIPNGPLDREQPLLTVGDAISSYLKRNDETTKHLSAMGAFDLGRWSGKSAFKYEKSPASKRRLANIYYPWKKYRLAHAVSQPRWGVLTLL
jgi:hypothetical protein